jgi:hypothetical protein
MYARYEKFVLSTSPESGGKISRTINAKSDIKNIRNIRKLVLEIGMTRKTVSKCSSLSSRIKKAEIKLKMNGIIVIKNKNNKEKFAASGNIFSILGAIICIIILENKIIIIG